MAVVNPCPRWALLALTCLTVVAVACGGSSKQSSVAPVRIGAIIDCSNPDSELFRAGAELPLLAHGAKLRGALPSDGVTDGVIAKTPVKLLFECEQPGIPTSVLFALASLVERRHADIVLGPAGVDDGLAVREYARHHPKTTFMLTGYEQSSTLKQHAPNVFRFQADASQWAGSLGTYAVQKLGWKRIATVAEGDPSGWPTTSGFDVEVCALGGRIVHPQWPFSLEDQGTLADKLHNDDLDGVFLQGAQGTGSFIEKWRAFYPHLGRHLVVGWLPLFHSRAQLLGVVGVSPDPFEPTPAWSSYLHRLKTNFRDLRDPDFLNQAYYDGMAPVLQALVQVGGDVSDGQRRLMAALTHLDYHAPEGDIALDNHNQGIVPVYLGKVVRNAAGHTVIKQIAVTKVDQSFGGHLTASTPAPSARQAPCTRGNPPPWAR